MPKTALFLVVALAGLTSRATAQSSSVYCTPGMTPIGVTSAAHAGALFCMDLVPIPDLAHISALIELRPVESPTGVAVTRDGHHRYRLLAVIDSLPSARDFGGTVLVAWATTLAMDTLIRLGTVSVGRNDLGEVSLDQFRVLVTAEPNPAATRRAGRIVLRGTSPSTRALAHRDMMRAGPLGNAPMTSSASRASAEHQHGDWPMPPMDPRMPAMAGMESLRPDVAPYLPKADTTRVPLARPRELLQVRSGDTIRLEAALVKRRIAGKTLVMYGFNGQYPGPLIQVQRTSEIVVDFRNSLDQPSTVHWHGIRLDNRFDGVPHVTQEMVAPGGRFFYTIRFPDAGIYWYHPHHREDTQQDLGLYGNLMVEPDRPGYYGASHRSEVLMLDDLLLGPEGLTPFGVDTPTHALMGRFGNVMLVNGEPDYRLNADSGAVIRFFLTNASNTRVFNVSFSGARMKLVGSDVGKFEREEWVESVVLAPAERYIVDVRFERTGLHALENRVRALDHMAGTYFAEIDTLASITVSRRAAEPDLAEAFARLRDNPDVIADLDRVRADFNRPPDQELILSMRVGDVPPAIAAMAAGYPVPVDWNDGMPMMNWASTGNQVRWIVRDARTGRENMDVLWRFRRGNLVRLRVVNDPSVFHAMAHPIHVHGQRLLVVSRNGLASSNRVWKDTALIQAGESVELLVEMSNPGRWMLHCHIAEHLGAGMMMVFEVQ